MKYSGEGINLCDMYLHMYVCMLSPSAPRAEWLPYVPAISTNLAIK